VQELALQVTLVGMVHDKEERATDVSFQLDDTTGQIEVKRWIDGQEQHEMQEMNNIRNFTYVRVHGHLRSFQGKRNIVAFSVRPITDFNELTFHFLEVIYVHLSNIRAQGGTAAAPTHAGTAGVGPHGIATTATNPSHYNQVTAHFTIISCQLSATIMSCWFLMCHFL
jgi:replication factor A2